MTRRDISERFPRDNLLCLALSCYPMLWIDFGLTLPQFQEIHKFGADFFTFIDMGSFQILHILFSSICQEVELAK